MQQVFRAVFFYVIGALALAGGLYEDFPRLLHEALVTTAVSVRLMLGSGVYIGPVLAVALIVLGWRRLAGRALPLALVTLSALLLPIGFSFTKNAIPELVPYYADPALAAFDNWLHFGHDPWRVLHDLLEGPAMGRAVDAIYLNLWALPALAFPIVVVATETDEARMLRYVWLFFGAWFVLGNLLAVAGSSVGPVYYDRLLGDDRFAALGATLGGGVLSDTALVAVQDRLWARYQGGGLDLGLGISAFPSMHVAVAFLTALYMAERSRWLALPGLAFFAAILILSVYTGYHYAVDGYASVAVILLANALLRRRAGAGQGATILRPAAASQLLHSVR